MGQFVEAAPSVPLYQNSRELRSAFEGLPKIKAKLLPGEPAFWTLPRTQGEWRLPANTGNLRESDGIVSLPMRTPPNAVNQYRLNIRLTELRKDMKTKGFLSSANYSTLSGASIENAYLNMVPQPMIMHQEVAKVIEEHALNTLPYFAHENSLARREYDQPMLLMRADVVVDREGNIQMCEVDDVCSLWSWSPEYNPIVESHIMALEDQMGLPIRSAELFEGKRIETSRVTSQMIFSAPDGERITVDEDGYISYKRLVHHYFHSEDWWGGLERTEWQSGRYLKEDELALVVRARKRAPAFQEFMNYYGPRSITMAWNRDQRAPLAAANLGIHAANLDEALEFGNTYLKEKLHQDERLVYKADGARTEHTGIHNVHGRGNQRQRARETNKTYYQRPGESSASQIRNKFIRSGYDGEPVLIQPFMKPPTLEQAGVVFLDRDHADIRQQVGVREDAGEKVTPGREGDFSMIFRTFMVYVPKEKKFVHIGGMWQASPGYIVHGGSHSVAGPLYVDGQMGNPDIEKYGSLLAAEEMVKTNSLTKQNVSKAA